MSAVSRKAPREDGGEEVKTIPMTVRASATIYEKLRVEADARGISVPALIIYQMGEWLRGDELDRKSPAGDPIARRERRGDRRGRHDEDPEEDAMLWNCSACGTAVPEEEFREAGFRCPECEEPSGSYSPADAEGEEESDERSARGGSARKVPEREEPKVPDVLKCSHDPALGEPCGWAGKKSEAISRTDPETRERNYFCPKCLSAKRATVIQKTRVFRPKDDVLSCPECKTAYRRDELKEDRSWGKDWLLCPREDCGRKIIEAVPAAKQTPPAKGAGRKFDFPWEPDAADKGKRK